MKKNLLKSVFAALLALCMTAGLCACGSKAPAAAEPEPAPAPAVTEPAPEPAPAAEPAAAAIDRATAEKYELSDVGITFYLPDEFKETKGLVDMESDGFYFGDGGYYAACDYCGFTEEWYNSLLQAEELDDADIQKYYDNSLYLFEIIGVDDGSSAADIAEAYNGYYGEGALSASDLTELKKLGDITYYRIREDHTGNYANLEPEYAAEYDELSKLVDLILENAEFYKPVGAYDGLAGKQVSFVTTDIDGNVVTSEEIFGKYDVTMVNVWATWCHWCIVELPELQQINARLADKNCAIIGLLGDGVDEETVELGRSQLAEAGCTYLCILPFDGWEEVFPMEVGWPTSFYVDSEGRMVSTPIPGAATDKYEEKIDSILSGLDTPASAETAPVANSENAYRIFVVDRDNKPVVGAMVQFCTNDICKIAPTDENGAAVFNDPEGVYEVHVLKAPEGYKANETVYKTPDTYSDLTIVLDRG